MPRKPVIFKKRRKGLSESELAYLTDADVKLEGFAHYDLWCLRHGMPGIDGSRGPGELWREFRAEYLPLFIEKNPCRRLLPWWEWDAPRQPDRGSGWFYEGKLPEPRRRLGGVGTPDFEVLNYVPEFDRGIPTGWISKRDEDFYNGRSLDIFGNPMNEKWPPGSGHYKEGDFKGVAIDPNDPPQFESEAAYLRRYGFLSEAEKKYLARHPELLEPEKLTFEEEESHEMVQHSIQG